MNNTYHSLGFIYTLSVVDPFVASTAVGKNAGVFDAVKPNKATASSSTHRATS